MQSMSLQVLVDQLTYGALVVVDCSPQLDTFNASFSGIYAIAIENQFPAPLDLIACRTGLQFGADVIPRTYCGWAVTHFREKQAQD